MLRLIVLLLLLANGAYFAWARGLLADWGVAPAQQSEPQRLAQQIRPEALKILPADEAKKVEVAAAAPKPAECLLAGPFEEAQAAPLRASLASWPTGSWTLEQTVEPARWIVYMGKYPSIEAVNKKKGELRQLGVSFQSLLNPALEFGLSLGGFRTEEEANQQLAQLSQRGVHTARVVVERPEVRGQQLKFPAVDDALRPRLDELKTVLAGKPLRSCR
ncbi:SPOR domain-containing protein [Caenimonas terrae]|uniref:SPOR domain-containing protein n=1 Tax=Caenimonas terrae TaxID=696074 RepID=A0ABW0NBX8_9BURK